MQERLQRVLGTPAVLLIGINAVVGGGIFLLPGQLAAEAGAASVLAFLVAGALVMLVGLSYAEVGTMFDRTGGPVPRPGQVRCRGMASHSCQLRSTPT